MSRKIEITFSNGRVYSIPAKIVAEHRADYYATKFEGEEGTYDEIFEKEMWALDDDNELVIWLSNNMNWEDVKDEAKEQRIKEIDKSKEFTNADKEIVDE